MAQLVGAPPCHGGGREFESLPGRCCFTANLIFFFYGILAQLGEHLPYKQRVIGSSPIGPICRSGGTGRRPGLKIPWVVIPVPVRFRSAAWLETLENQGFFWCLDIFIPFWITSYLPPKWILTADLTADIFLTKIRRAIMNIWFAPRGCFIHGEPGSSQQEQERWHINHNWRWEIKDYQTLQIVQQPKGRGYENRIKLKW